MSDYPFDPFEIGMLTVARHFLNSFEDPQSQSWHLAYSVAVERWGDVQGLWTAHELAKMTSNIKRHRRINVISLGCRYSAIRLQYQPPFREESTRVAWR